GEVYAPGARGAPGTAPAIPERPDRCPMGPAGAPAARRRPQRPRTAGDGAVARDCQRAVVHETNGLSLALSAARSAAPLHRALLFGEVDRRWDPGRGAAAVARTGPPARGARGAAHCGDYR